MKKIDSDWFENWFDGFRKRGNNGPLVLFLTNSPQKALDFGKDWDALGQPRSDGKKGGYRRWGTWRIKGWNQLFNSTNLHFGHLSLWTIYVRFVFLKIILFCKLSWFLFSVSLYNKSRDIAKNVKNLKMQWEKCDVCGCYLYHIFIKSNLIILLAGGLWILKVADDQPFVLSCIRLLYKGKMVHDLELRLNNDDLFLNSVFYTSSNKAYLHVFSVCSRSKPSPSGFGTKDQAVRHWLLDRDYGQGYCEPWRREHFLHGDHLFNHLFCVETTPPICK